MDTYQQTNQAQTGFNKRTEGALEPAGADLLAGNTAIGTERASNTAIGTERAGGMNGVCDPPSIYNAAGAREAVNYVNDTGRERTYEPLDVQKTIVQHEIERVKPILHQVEHRTVLHEVVHHKVAAPVDLGITEVVYHGHTDQCGQALSGLHLNDATSGATTGAYSSDATHGLTGTGATTGTTGAYGQTGHSTQEPGGVKGLINKVVPGPGPFKATDAHSTGTTKGVAGTERSEYGSETGTPAYAGTTGVAPAYATTGATTGAYSSEATKNLTGSTATTPYDSTGTTGTTGAYGQTEHSTQEPGGIKGMINKVVPGPGPFKATDTDSTKGVAGTERSEYGSETGTPAYAGTTGTAATTGVTPAYAGTTGAAPAYTGTHATSTGPAIPVDSTGYAGTTGPAIPVDTNEYANRTGTTGYTGTAVPVGSSDYVNTTGTTGHTGTAGTTGTSGYSNTTGTTGTTATTQHKEPHGIKALINKVIPGPGPFK